MASRWNITLQFLSGPLSVRPPPLTLGPRIRLGQRRHDSGICLAAYSGIEDEHAVVAVDPTGSVDITPVAAAPVRVAADRPASWRDHPPIREPMALVPGDVVHLGPIYRGVSFVFMHARPVEHTPHTPRAAPPHGHTVTTRRHRSAVVAIIVGTLAVAAALFGARIASEPPAGDACSRPQTETEVPCRDAR